MAPFLSEEPPVQPCKWVVLYSWQRGNFSVPANSSTSSLSRPKLNGNGSHTEVETQEEKHPQGVKVGEEQAEPDQPDRYVGEEEGDAHQEADGPAGLSLVVAECGNEQVGQRDGGSNPLQAVLVQVWVEHRHVHLLVGLRLVWFTLSSEKTQDLILPHSASYKGDKRQEEKWKGG